MTEHFMGELVTEHVLCVERRDRVSLDKTCCIGRT